MYQNNLYIVALIPARSGSKEIPNKNIKLYKGLPLFVHSINIGFKSKYIKEVYVSTDSKEYQDIALKYNAQVTPLRPKNISDDLSPDIDTFHFFLNLFNKKNVPDLIVHLRPTYPNRDIIIVDDCIKKFIDNYEIYDSLRTVIPISKSPFKMYHLNNNKLIPFIETYKDIQEPYNQARQLFPDAYLHNGYIDIIKTSVLLNKNLLSGTNIFPYIMDVNEKDDIDNIEDFRKSEEKNT